MLAIKEVDAKTHSGVLHLFNQEYVREGDYFNHDDYQMFKECEYIRSASDYDDFYIAEKSDCERQIKNAEIFLDKVRDFLTED